MNIGINGFGRIGRCLIRILWETGTHTVAHINELNPDIDNIAYLLKYDTTYGKFKAGVRNNGGNLIIEDDNKHWEISISSNADITAVNWRKYGCNCVVVSSGADREADCAKTIISNGVEHVIVTNHYKGADFILLFGINDANINANNHRVIATSICDSNAIAPVLNVLNAKIGIEYCFVTTLHPWLSYQRLTDSFIHSESFPAAFYNYYPLGRASVNNLIPKSTSAGNVIEDLIPTLAGKVSSFSYRTPLAIVSSSDCSLVMARVTSIEEITTVVKEFSEQCKAPNGRQIVKTGKESLVSSDYIAEQASCTVDMDWLNLDNGRFLKCILWYDNEWGYTSRVADTIDLLSKQKGERRL